MKSAAPSFHLSDFLWDLWCIASVVGIWPRFIEPNMLQVNSLNLQLPQLPKPLEGLKIAQFSDLHLNSKMSDTFLKKLTSRILEQQPDIIVFTGDFLCYAKTESPERLKNFLNTLHAPLGCYAVLGNHDYAECISINERGEYDIQVDDSSMILKGFSRLFKTTTLAKKTSERAIDMPPHAGLLSLLADTPFHLSHNENRLVPIGGSFLNICGLGEYVVGQAKPDAAFKNYNDCYPGIILLHNPDGISLLENSPGDLVLCGHTHGGQVYLPWMWKKFTLLEDMTLLRGIKKKGNKTVYINRGVGGVMKFRWFALPEILFITLQGASS
jgi:predicted MPP superfamily phosphohydrolase